VGKKTLAGGITASEETARMGSVEGGVGGGGVGVKK